MALNTFKCNYLTPLHFKGLKHVQCICSMGTSSIVSAMWHVYIF